MGPPLIFVAVLFASHPFSHFFLFLLPQFTFSPFLSPLSLSSLSPFLTHAFFLSPHSAPPSISPRAPSAAQLPLSSPQYSLPGQVLKWVFVRSGSEGPRQEENSSQLYLYFRLKTIPEALPRASYPFFVFYHFSLCSFPPSLPPFFHLWRLIVIP